MAEFCTSAYKNACRICLSNRESLPIFGTSSDELGPLSSRIFACLSVEICQTDELPKQICHRCVSLMNVWHYFKLECDSAQQKLKKWYFTNSNSSSQVARHPEEDENFILREVVNIKLEPEDEAMDGTGSSMIVNRCLREIHQVNMGLIPDDVSRQRGFPEEHVADIEASGHKNQQQGSHSDSMNLVISGTSTVALNDSVHETDPVPLSQDDEMDDENLIRLAIESDDLDSELQEQLNGDDDIDEIDITYASSGNTNRSVLEITIEDSSDMPLAAAHNDMNMSQQENIKALSNDSHGVNIQNPFIMLKKEPLDGIEPCGIQIKKEIDDSSASAIAMATLNTVGTITSVEEPSNDPGFSFSSTARKFRCSYCKIPFRTLEQKVAHEERKHKKNKYSAKVVSREKKSSVARNSSTNDQVYNYQSVNLSKISNELFDEETTYCKSCKRKFTKGSFWRHIKAVHIKEDPFKCYVCKKIFPGRRELVTHRVRTVSKYCREGYSPTVDLSYIITHQEIPRGQTGRHECKVCSKLFMQMSSAKTHVRIHTGEKPFFCYKCNDREFLLRKSALKHVASCEGTISRDNPTLAPKGNTTPESSNLLNAPVFQSKTSKLNKAVEEGKNVCLKCNKIFNSGIGLSNHQRFCTGTRKCFSCFKSISRQNFKRHSRFCSVQNAASSFSEVQTSQSVPSSSAPSENISVAQGASVLRRNAPVTNIVNKTVAELLALHSDSDGKLSSFECKLCHRTMLNRKSLYAHLLKHSADVFRCELCNLRMRQRSTYDSHMAKFHGFDCEMTEKSNSTPFSINSVKSKPVLKYMGFKNLKLKCEVCLKLFSSAASLNYHKQSHKKVKCTKCEITFPATMEKSHVCTPKLKMDQDATSQARDETRPLQFTCHLCKKKFHTRKMLYQHKKMHIKVKIYKCKICGNSYSDAGALQQHKETQHAEELIKETKAAQLDKADPSSNISSNSPVHQKSPWECSICQKVYSGRDSWTRHMKLHNGGRQPMFVEGDATPVEKPQSPGMLFCSLCNRGFASKVSFLGHKGWHSRQLSGKSDAVIKLTSKDAKITFNESGSNTPIISETSQAKPEASQDLFKCPLCGKKFSSQKNLKCHITYHRKGFLLNKKSKPAQQKVTPVVTLQNILPLPKNIHRCKLCFKSFLEEASLLSHMKFHASDSVDTASGQKDSVHVVSKQEAMTCKLCNKEYRCRKSLKFHMMGHSGEKPFKCRSCSNQYSNANALAKHEKERHSSVLRPFSCNRCKTSFMVKEDLLAHYEKCTH